MRKVFRAHFAYLCNRTNLWILLFVLLLSLLGFTEAALTLAEELSSLKGLYYFENSFFLLKLLAPFTAIFTFAYAFLKERDQYGELFLVKEISRLWYFSSKVLALSLYLAFFLLLEFSLYLLSGAVLLRFVKPNLLAFLRLYLVSLYYGLLGLAFIQTVKNLLVLVIPYLLFIAGLIVNDSEGAFRLYYNLLFPNFLPERPELVAGRLNFPMLFLLALFNLFLYLEKDL